MVNHVEQCMDVLTLSIYKRAFVSILILGSDMGSMSVLGDSPASRGFAVRLDLNHS